MGDNKLNLILKGLKIVVIAIGVILLGIIVSKSVADESVVEGESNYGSYLDMILYIIYSVGIISATVAIVFGLVTFFRGLINDFKSQLGTLVGLIVFVTIGLVSYFVLPDATVLNAYEASGITVSPVESIFAGGSMIFVYILGIVAVISVVWAEVSRIFK